MAATNSKRWAAPNYIPRSSRWTELPRAALIPEVFLGTVTVIEPPGGKGFGGFSSTSGVISRLSLRFIPRLERWTTYRRLQRASTTVVRG